MTRTKVLAARAEAARFIERVDALLKSRGRSLVTRGVDEFEWLENQPWDGANQPKAQAATKRASLDLTRALADMRRPA